jgi:site-specific DNA-methyltransferase (adenine-specific)
VLVWKKPNDAGFFHASNWRQDWEPIFVVGKWPRMPATESAIIPTGAGSHRQYAQGIHPHAKPIDTLQRLMLRCPSGRIADPFAGSGSTLAAAKQLGRRAIGVELDEKYCEIAARRCAQDTLFGGAA